VYDAERHMAAKVGTVRILYRASTISLQAAVHPKYMLGALTMKEEEEEEHNVLGALAYRACLLHWRLLCVSPLV
jgi:hypothetical protein